MDPLREYVVILHKHVDHDDFWNQMECSTHSHAHVPDRPVNIINERPGSLRSCHYELSDTEAEALRQDPRVCSVDLTLKDLPHVNIRPFAIQYGNFNKTVNSQGTFLNWALRRCVSAINPYGTGVMVDGEYPYTLDGAGVDIVIADSGIQADHPEFTDMQNVSRVQLIDWYTASGLPGTQPEQFYTDPDGHGTHVAGIAAGKTYGWAKNSRIYSMKINQLIEDASGIPLSDALDAIKLWHMNKPVDPQTGYKRPTVVNMSFGSEIPVYQISGGVYRGTPWTGTALRPDLGMVSALTGFKYAPLDTDVQEMLDAGIHVCVAAGNNSYKADVPGGLDYNNYYEDYYGINYYHRGSSPHAPGVVYVGSTDSVVYDSLTEQKAEYSVCGALVDIYAPGTHVMSSYIYGDEYYADTDFYQANLSGTSMAAPQVAGMISLYLQLNPWATPAQVKTWLTTHSESVIYTTGSDTDYTNPRSLLGGSNMFMFNPFNQAVPLRSLGLVGWTGVIL